ncbi:MAG TPA: protein phosphatase 2C domain-containing protein [Kofleriaceae bacterium]|jgi:serine/threonine protein phosphatase PrpC
MDTKTFGLATGVVTGAAHRRLGRNGQDAAASWRGSSAAAVVVCDGCSGGISSEVGAVLGARLAIRALASRLDAGASPADPSLWAGLRAELAGAIHALAGADVRAVADCFLFTIVAGAVDREHAAVWAIGDGAYAIGGMTRRLGPFAENRPPYLAYDLIGEPSRAAFETAAPATLVVATDGALDLAHADGTLDLARFTAPRFAEHPDALRRELAVLARGDERIDWDARRIERTRAALQDDCAIGVIRMETAR